MQILAKPDSAITNTLDYFASVMDKKVLPIKTFITVTDKEK
jgi:hypothetical protein